MTPSGRATLVSVILLAAFSLVTGFSAAGPGRAYAATTVVQPISCSVGGSASSVAVAVSATGANATSILCDGVTHYVSVNSGVTVTLTEPTDGTYTRYRFSGGTTSVSTTACGTTPCSLWVVSNYYQLYNTYQALPKAQTTWDAGLGSVSVVGTVAGTSATVCSIALTAGGGAETCSGWSDYGSLAAFGSITSSSSSVQWARSGGTFSPTSADNTYSASYYKQVSESFQYTLIGGSTGFSVPSLTYTSLGTSVGSYLSSSSSSFWLDYGGTWSVPVTITGPSASERFALGQSGSGTSSLGASINLVYYHQYALTFSYSVQGGGTGYSSPTLTSTQYGRAYAPTLASSQGTYWLDSGASWKASNPLPGSSAGERWYSSGTSSGTMNSPSTLSLAYYHQYALTLSYAVLGGGAGYTPPTLSYSAFGSSTSASLQGTPSAYWADSGSSWSIPNPLPGSTSTERWATNQTSSGTASSPLTSAAQYYNQYPVSFSYSVVGGKTGYTPPAVQFVEFGSTVSGTSGWADSGSSYAYANPLVGSTNSTRWATPSPAGQVTAPVSADATYYYQYALVMSYAVRGGGAPQSPVLNYTSLGSPASGSVSQSSTTYWLDTSSAWSVNGQLGGSNSSQRWTTGQETSGTAASPLQRALAYYHQYSVTLAYSVVGGGSPPAPALNYSYLGAPVRTTLPNASSSFWMDSGAQWSADRLLPTSTRSERWLAAVQTSGAVSSSFSETVRYDHQYYVDVAVNTSAGGSVSPSTGWYNDGRPAPLNQTATAGWKFIFWSGAGSGSYNGSTPYVSLPVNGPANETAMFYPGLTIRTDSQGAVAYLLRSINSSVSPSGEGVVYVPPGSNVSLRAVPSSAAIIFTGWTGDIGGTNPQTWVTVGAPKVVQASFGLDYPDIQVFAFASILVSMLAVYVLAVRRLEPRRRRGARG